MLQKSYQNEYPCTVWVVIVVIYKDIRENSISKRDTLMWKLLHIAVYFLVGERPADHGQTVITDMKLAGMGRYIGAAPPIEGLAGIGTRPDQGTVGKNQLLLLPGT